MHTDFAPPRVRASKSNTKVLLALAGVFSATLCLLGLANTQALGSGLSGMRTASRVSSGPIGLVSPAGFGRSSSQMFQQQQSRDMMSRRQRQDKSVERSSFFGRDSGVGVRSTFDGTTAVSSPGSRGTVAVVGAGLAGLSTAK